MNEDKGKVSIIVVAILVVVVFFMYITPGLVVNGMLGRLSDNPNGLFIASLCDWKTWEINIATWATCVLIFILCSKGDNK